MRFRTELQRSARLLSMARTVSYFGSAFSELAIPLFTLHLTGSAFHAGIQYALLALARVGGTYLASRSHALGSDKKGLIFLDLCLSFTTLLPVVLFSISPLVAIYLCTLLSGVLVTIQAGFSDSYVGHLAAPALDPDSARGWLIGQIEAGRNLGFLAGYICAFFVSSKLGYRAAFIVDALTFLFSGVLLCRLPEINNGFASRGPTISFSILWRPRLRMLALVQVFVGIGIFVFNGSFIFAIKSQLGGQDWHITALLITQYGASYVGSFVPGILYRRFDSIDPDRLNVWLRALMAGFYLLIAFSKSVALFIVGNALLSFTFAVALPGAVSFWHRRVDRSELRVIGATLMTAIFFSGAFGSAIGATLISRLHFSWLYSLSALSLLLSGMILHVDLQREKVLRTNSI